MEKEKLNTGKTITIYDIAEEAGVSASTVSRVLNGSASVRKEKKDRILDLINKYNFKPNALAKGLSDTATKTIGIITADVRNPYYSALFVACEMAAEKAGYSVNLKEPSFSPIILTQKKRGVNNFRPLFDHFISHICPSGITVTSPSNSSMISPLLTLLTTVSS